MAFFDLSLEQLQTYAPPRHEPNDFDLFWRDTLNAARQFPLNAKFDALDWGLQTIDVYDVTFNGYGGQAIKGWLMLPNEETRKVSQNLSGLTTGLPCVVEYIGYGGGRGFPYNWLMWSSAGYAHLVMDTRGQGSVSLHGDTPDIEDGANPQVPGFMTRGILSPQSYYYRRLFTDAVRAIETARSFPGIDAERIAVTGGSQGGGIALAVAALASDWVKVAMPDVPFLCHYRRAAQIIDTDPYAEIARFCKTHRTQIETVFQTLAYFDGMNFAPRAKAHALFSTALMDNICPPSTVYAAYNYYAGPKRINVYEFNQHDGGGIHQFAEKLKFLNALWR